jgi:cysteine desulfurase
VIHLDHNASTPLVPAAAAAMLPWLGPAQANASSAHAAGQAARAAVDSARRSVAELAGAEPGEVVFTGSGSEADALGLIGAALARRAPGRARIVISAIEHEAVLAAADFLAGLGFEPVRVPPEASGRVDPGRFLAAALASETAVAALIAASNETGVVQPVPEVAAALRARGIPLLSDAVQAVGRMPVRLSDLGADLIAYSAHKIGGPQGAGALIIKRGTPLTPLPGGAQEGGRRGGTEAVAAIAGFGAAAREVPRRLLAMPAVAARRDRLARALAVAFPAARVHGESAPRLPNTLAIGFPGADARALVIALDRAGVLASRGSACRAGAEEPSHVVRAMGVPAALARGSIRLSLGVETTESEIDQAAAVIIEVVARALGGSAASMRREPEEVRR